MKIEGINDSIRVTEISHWFDGNAGDICGLFHFHEDPAEQYRLMIGELKKYYGRCLVTTESMLEQILDGSVIKENDRAALHTFVVGIRKFQVVGFQLDRQKHLDSPDVLGRIIRARVPFVAKRWAKKRMEKGDKWDGVNTDDRDLSFKDLVEVLESQLRFADTYRCVVGDNKGVEKGVQKKAPVQVAVHATTALSRQPGELAAAGLLHQQEMASQLASQELAVVGQPQRLAATDPWVGRQRFGRNGNMRYVDRVFQAPVANQATPNNTVSAAAATPLAYPLPVANRVPLPAQSGGFPNVAFPPPMPVAPSAPLSGAGHAGGSQPPMLRPEHAFGRSTGRPDPPPAASTWCCRFCGGLSFHRLQDCTTFLTASVPERNRILRVNGNCYLCFGKNHKVQDCNADVQCSICNKRHNSMLHVNEHQAPQASGNRTA